MCSTQGFVPLQEQLSTPFLLYVLLLLSSVDLCVCVIYFEKTQPESVKCQHHRVAVAVDIRIIYMLLILPRLPWSLYVFSEE